MKQLVIIVLFFLVTNGYSQNYHWERIFIEPTKAQVRFMSVSCADSLNCVAIGNYQLTLPIVKATSDGGKTWITVMTDTAIINFDNTRLRRVCDVSFPDTNFCLISADSGYFWRSTDGLKTWTRGNVKVNYSKSQRFQYLINFSGKLKGGIKNPDKRFHLTSDGGETWIEPMLNLPDSLLSTANSDIQIINENIVIILAYNPIKQDYILRSDDFGKNWIAYGQTPQRIRQIKFLDSLEGWGVGGKQIEASGVSHDIILHTIDGGRNWEIQLDSMPRKKTGLYCVDFYDRMHGMAIGAWNNVWVTEDGGKNWIFDPWFDDNYPAAILTNISWLNSQSYIAVTYDNELFKYTKEPVSVEEQENKSIEFSISPNPASDFIEISIPQNDHTLKGVVEGEIRIFNVFGEEVSTTPPFGHPFELEGEVLKIDVSILPAGVYFVRIGEKVEKFVKI